jgi:hypothetical protein
MRHIWWALVFVIAWDLPLVSQSSPSSPQTARQALIEMFLAKGGDKFVKHLPDSAKKMLIHKGENTDSSIILRIASLGGSGALGEHVETFDSGPNLLVSEQPTQHERIEVAVEHDSLMGEADEIELSVHVFKDGEEQSLPVVPRLIFSFVQEKEIWCLTEVTVAAHVPLTDPDYLKGLRKEQDEANESAAKLRMGFITQAETRYAASHADRGFSCALSDLFPMPATGGDDTASYVPNFGSEDSNGYHFSLSGCEGTPASKYRLLAVPADSNSEMKTFCADQSGTLKTISDAKPSRCFSQGRPANEDGSSAPSMVVD